MKHSTRQIQGSNPGEPSNDSSNQHSPSFENQTIAFTRFRGSDDSRLTKAFYLDDNGSICKDSQPIFSNGTAETVTLEKLADIERVIDSLAPHEGIATGIFDSPSCKINTKINLTNNILDAGVRSRSKDHMQQPGLGIALMDYDPSPYMPDYLRCGSPKELMSKLKAAIPKLRFVAYSGTGSCSSGVYMTESNELYKGGGGIHIYVPVSGVDLEVFRHNLQVKLWNAGLGFISFARNGAMLTRCIVDLSVLSPEHLIYEAAPVLGDGLSRKPREWQHRGGTTFLGDLS